MQIIAAELIATLTETGCVKFVLNDAVIALFPATWQHRDFEVPGVRYRDDSGGNALAGVLTPVRVEIRRHRAFSPSRVAALWRRVLENESCVALRNVSVFYGSDVLE